MHGEAAVVIMMHVNVLLFCVGTFFYKNRVFFSEARRFLENPRNLSLKLFLNDPYLCIINQLNDQFLFESRESSLDDS